MIRMSLDQSKERAIEVKASDGDAATKLTRAQSVTRRTNLASQACAARSWLSEPWFVSNYIFLPSFIFFSFLPSFLLLLPFFAPRAYTDTALELLPSQVT